MRTLFQIAPVLAAFALGGCAIDDPTASSSGSSLFAPGVARGQAMVSPLIVGDRLLAAGEAELALDSYVRAAGDRDGLTTDLKMSMAEAQISLGRLSQAERLLRGVVETEPRNARAWNNLGVVLLEQGELGEANVTFRTAFALQPSPEIRENLRLSDEKLDNVVYADEADTAFTLTRRTNGSIGLIRPE